MTKTNRKRDVTNPWWSRRRLLSGAGASIGSLWLSGCGITNKRDSAEGNPLAPNEPAAVSVRVKDSVIGKIAPGFMGLSYEKDSMGVRRFSPDHVELVGLFRRLGGGVLRIGGKSVDRTHWAANGAARTDDTVSPADVDALAGFLKATGWRCLYGVNLASSTPAAAAEEVRYVVQALGSALYGIEIGNECETYAFSDYPIRDGWDLKRFEALWGQFRAAIVKSSPGVMVTGPGAGSNVPRWTVPFVQDVGNSQIGMITQHYYRANGRGATATIEKLISRDSELKVELSLLNACAKKIGVPFRITETNSFYDGGTQGVSDTYASALWVIDHLFTIALSGGVGANLHGGGDESDEFYAPIRDHDGAVLEVRPEYYGMLVFSLAGNGDLLDTRVSAHDLNITAYAIEAAKGDLRIVVVNKDRTQSVPVLIDVGATVRTARQLSMRAPGLDGKTGVTIQGATLGRDGAFAPQAAAAVAAQDGRITCKVDALSCALISVSTAT